MDCSLGSVFDLDIATDIIMKDNGFSEDDFPKSVFDEVKRVQKNFNNEIEKLEQVFESQDEKYNLKYQRKDQRKLLCFSIDNKNTRAIDDVISIQKVDDYQDIGIDYDQGDEFWKIGIHIADINQFVVNNKPIDKEA